MFFMYKNGRDCVLSPVQSGYSETKRGFSDSEEYTIYSDSPLTTLAAINSSPTKTPF